MDFDYKIASAAAQRWNKRSDERSSTVQSIKEGKIAESPERIRQRLDRLEAQVVDQSRSRAAPAPALLNIPSIRVGSVAHERIIGQRDLLPFGFFELAGAVGRFVGRVHVRQRPGNVDGFGTGFMVSPRLLLTNNHVLPSADVARHSEIEFDYEQQRNGRAPAGVFFKLEPDTFFVTDEALDYALVAVAERGDNNAALKRYGWSRLIEAQGKALRGDALNIIQHPNGDPKQIAIRSNELVDLLDDFAHYVTDTEPGSSGSPVYNDQWEVVALHHSGVPRTNADGKWLAKDGSIWKDGMDVALIDWVANEGIRVSRLVEHIRGQDLDTAQRVLRDELLDLEPPHPFEVLSEAMGASTAPSTAAVGAPVAAGNGAVTWTIPLQITVQFGAPQTGSLAAAPQAAQTARADGAEVDVEYAAAQATSANGHSSK